jgi:glucan biosynthesis protein
MRCYLKLGDETLSETWLYQFYPGSPAVALSP